MTKKILRVELIRDGYKTKFSYPMDFHGEGTYWIDLPTTDLSAWNAAQVKITVEEVEVK